MTFGLRAHAAVHRPLRRQSRRHDGGDPQLQHRLPDRTGAAAVPRAEPPRPAGVRRPSRCIRSSRPRRTTSTSSIRTSRRRTCTSTSAGFQRSLGQRHGVRSPLRRQPQQERLDDGELEQRREHLRDELPRTSSSSRRRTCAANVAGRAAARSFALHRAGHGHVAAADLPGLLQRRSLRRAPPIRRRTRRRTSPTPRGPAISATTSRIRRTRPTICTRTRRSGRTRSTRACRRTSSCMNPAVDQRQHHAVAGRLEVRLAAARFAAPASRRAS